MGDTEAKTRGGDARGNKALDPQATARLKQQFGEDVLAVLRLEEGPLDLAAAVEQARAEVARREVAKGFNEVALQRRMYENEIVRQDAEIFAELALLVRSIGERYRALTGLPPLRRD